MGSQPPLIKSNLYIITYVINLPTENSVGVAIPNTSPPPTLAPLNGGMHSRKKKNKAIWCVLVYTVF